MKRYLITAGNTREMIDRVRDWGNVFTGNTGYGIAKAIAAAVGAGEGQGGGAGGGQGAGGRVELLTSNAQHAAEAGEFGIAAATFRSHGDLEDALRERVTGQAYDAIFMTAAVADYKPVRTYSVAARSRQADGTEVWVVRDAQAGKVKSSHPAIAVLGERTSKLVDQFRRDWGFNGTLVKFKLEVDLSKDELLTVGEASRVASGADYLVANTLDMVEGEAAGAYLLSAGEAEWVARDRLATRCATIVAALGQ